MPSRSAAQAGQGDGCWATAALGTTTADEFLASPELHGELRLVDGAYIRN